MGGSGENGKRDENRKLSENRKRWEETTLRKTLDRFPERKDEFTTGSGSPVERVYTPEDAPGAVHGSDGGPHDSLGLPGEYPFTRGVQPTMYRGRLWTMRQYAGFGTAAETNERFRYLLGQGQTGLSVAFDLPTQMGYDADDAMAEGEVGRVGVSVCSVEDMKTLFDDIPLADVSTSMTINSTAPLVLAMYLVVAEETGVYAGDLRGTVQNDILKEYAARGTHIFPPKPSVGFAMDLCAYCAEHVPKWNTMSISGYHIREAGATAVEELAFTLADGIAYVEAARERGLDLTSFTSRLSFFFDAHNDLFEEVAKLRAARRMWARIVRERFGIDSARSQMMRFHTQTAGCTLTAQQPELNVVRVTVQALAAVLGGTQSLHTNSRDEALALPSEKSARIALRTQQVLAEESGVTSVADPLGGSYYVEALTDSIEGEAQAELDRIEGMGGATAAIEKGHFQRAIAKSAYEQQKEIERRDRLVVGVNSYEVDEPATMDVLKVDPSIRGAKLEALADLKRARSGADAEKALVRLESDAAAGRPTMEAAIECARARATLGEMTDALERVFGRYRPSDTAW